MEERGGSSYLSLGAALRRVSSPATDRNPRHSGVGARQHGSTEEMPPLSFLLKLTSCACLVTKFGNCTRADAERLLEGAAGQDQAYICDACSSVRFVPCTTCGCSCKVFIEEKDHAQCCVKLNLHIKLLHVHDLAFGPCGIKFGKATSPANNGG
ncbi:hypothetical protein E2562_006656 [Oryza meyeriana var. granulata]|uniref:Uncharacterized protein n=1 Tax=Oryza meyeriana var. granulata TaxID=110450 RepID=A0A6G1EH03_9ORYZ|nr:hypothetical protein E2562_006656 [Oryza meyeriana var. granulata]